jgi:penicillin V acylase-like amidase (Ntn superfamily)
LYNTEDRTVTDLTNRMYFFELTTSPSIIWSDFDPLKLGEARGPICVDRYDDSLVGDVTDRFAPVTLAF